MLPFGFSLDFVFVPSTASSAEAMLSTTSCGGCEEFCHGCFAGDARNADGGSEYFLPCPCPIAASASCLARPACNSTRHRFNSPLLTGLERTRTMCAHRHELRCVCGRRRTAGSW